MVSKDTREVFQNAHMATVRMEQDAYGRCQSVLQGNETAYQGERTSPRLFVEEKAKNGTYGTRSVEKVA
jgi:hypothetical protein